MSLLIGVGVVTAAAVFYLGRKGWYAFHKAVGIAPGALVYQDAHAPLSLSHISWQQLNLNKKHLKVLSDSQLRQLQHIDKKVADYDNYHNELESQNVTPILSEQQFVLHKMLYTRLPEMLASHYHLANINVSNRIKNEEKQAEAGKLLQEVLDNIEQRLDDLLAQMEEQHLQELRVMKNYIHSHDD